MNSGKFGLTGLWYTAGIIFSCFVFLLLLYYGSVYIPFSEVTNILFGGEGKKVYWETIIFENRLPMAVAATSCGASLSVAGLLMQTTFSNPLAGPSVLGVSSGASLGVAAMVLGGSIFFSGKILEAGIIIGAFIGSAAVILLLLVFSSLMKNNVVLLIVGIMVSYLCSSLISILNYFSPAEEIRSYLFWGLGSFTGLRLEDSIYLLILALITIFFTFFYVKPLNALLLGEKYCGSIGYSMPRIRSGLLILSGILTAISTAFCGPIGFIGLIVPHLCRMLFRSSNHKILLPASVIYGAGLSLFCAFLGIIPSSEYGVLPINVITPLIGVPVIVYLLVKRKKIVYFQ